MKLPFFIGLRYAGSQAGTQLVAFLSRVSILGLVVGVGLLLAVLSIMNGFDRELREKILGLVPQAAIYNHDGISNWRELQVTLERQEHIIAAVPFVQLSGLVAQKNIAEPVSIYGVDTVQELRVSRILEFVSESTLGALAERGDSIILGAGIGEKLGVEKGGSVLLLIPSADKSSVPTVKYFTVLDFVKSDTELDNRLALIDIQTAALLSGMPQVVSGMRLKLDDLFVARDVVWQTLLQLGGNYYGSSWLNTHGNLYHAIHLSKKLVALLMLLMVSIASFNVVSTLIMVVVEKQADIAILRTLGASAFTIMAIFIVQGTAIGVIGTSLGVLFGIGLAYVIEALVRLMESAFGIHFLNSDVYPLTYLPTQILWADVYFVVAVALAMSFVATIYPAWRASRVMPAEALRYE